MNVITAAFLHKQNLGELWDLLSEGHALPKEYAKPSVLGRSLSKGYGDRTVPDVQ